MEINNVINADDVIEREAEEMLQDEAVKTGKETGEKASDDWILLTEDERVQMLKKMEPVILEVCGAAVKPRPLYEFSKRAFDIVASFLGLIALSPYFAYVAHKIRSESPGPALFKQNRVGRNGRVFKMYKFRSMYIDAEDRLAEMMSQNKGKSSLLFKVDDDSRITPFGRKIRNNSVDELPQLINILKGEMSFVGPRPPLVREVIQYAPEQTVRLAVKGGLTGYWQLAGRNDADFDFCLEQDTKYIRERNFWIDLKLVFKTVFGIFSGKLSGK